MDYCGIGAVPFSIGCYAVYVNLDKLWQERHVRFTSLQNFINGCLAAGVAQTLSFPFETVKKKMQVRMECMGVYVLPQGGTMLLVSQTWVSLKL